MKTQAKAEPFFRIEDCSVVFGGLKAVKDVSFSLGPRDLVGLIGPNGAGKTTVFNLITGVYAPTSGRILFCGEQIAGPRRQMGAVSERDAGGRQAAAAGTPAASGERSGDRQPVERMAARHPREIARSGICRTFQNIRLFGGLTVLQNVLVAANSQYPQTLAGAMLRAPSYYEAEEAAHTLAGEILGALKLQEYAEVAARGLPYGAQRRLEIARALATRPRLLLLDEPAAGMNPHESAELMEMIRWVRETYGLSILMIEHDMKVVMGLCERVLVLENGALIADGAPQAVRADRRVIAAYLGEPDE